MFQPICTGETILTIHIEQSLTSNPAAQPNQFLSIIADRYGITAIQLSDLNKATLCAINEITTIDKNLNVGAKKMTTMRKVILTGFSKWGQEAYNSSWEILKDRHIPVPKGWQAETLQLPVSWHEAPAMLAQHIDAETRAVVCLGMTGGKKILCERIALNLIIPTLEVVDKKPYPSDHVCEDGPPAYWTTLPWRKILGCLKENGIACEQSHYAGPHTCNFIFYWVLHFAAVHRPNMLCGFVHVPPFEMHGGLPRETLCKTVDIIVDTVSAHSQPQQSRPADREGTAADA